MSLLISSMLSCINFFSQLQLCDGALDTSPTFIAPPSLGQFSVFTMCFPDEIADYEGIYGVMPSNDVASPEPGPTRLANPNRNPGDAQFYFFLFSVLLNFRPKIPVHFVFKSVGRNPDLTRLADPSRSLVYSDIFNYLIKTFGLFYSF